LAKRKKQRKWASRRISGGQIGNERKKTFCRLNEMLTANVNGSHFSPSHLSFTPCHFLPTLFIVFYELFFSPQRWRTMKNSSLLSTDRRNDFEIYSVGEPKKGVKD